MNETISVPKAIGLGTKIRLKDGVFRDLKIRQGGFSGIEKGKILLYLREGIILKVRLDDIDWAHHNEPKVED